MLKLFYTSLFTAQSVFIHWLRMFGYCFVLVSFGIFGLINNQPVSARTVDSTQINQVTQTATPSPAPSPRVGKPAELSIENIIQQPIEEHTRIETGEFTVSGEHVSHLDSSVRPGELGNMILYGHNKTHILGKLHDVRLGNKITIKTEDNQVFTYVVTTIKTVETTETEWLMPTPDAVVTIYTCTGWLDSKRLIVQGTLVQVSSSQSE